MQIISRRGYGFKGGIINTALKPVIKSFIVSPLQSSQVNSNPDQLSVNKNMFLYCWCLDHQDWLERNQVKSMYVSENNTLQIKVFHIPTQYSPNEFRDYLFSQSFMPIPLSITTYDAVFIFCELF